MDDFAEAADAELDALEEAEATDADAPLNLDDPDAVDAAIKEGKAVLHYIEERLKDPTNLRVEEIKHLRALRAEAQEKLKRIEEAQTEAAAGVEPEAKKRKPMTPEQRRQQEQGPDVLDWIEDTGSPIPVPPRSVRVKGGGRRPGKLATGHAHDQIESTLGVKDPGKSKWGTRVQDGKGNLDQVVDLYNRQHGTELDEDGFLDLVSEAITRRRNFSAESKAQREQQETDIQFQQEIREGDGPAAKETIPTQELVVGDEFTLNGEKFEVVDFDPDTDTITVQDGRKFGRQQLRDEGMVKVDKGSLESDGEVDGIGADWDAALQDTQAEQETQEDTQEEVEATNEIEVGGVRFINGGVDMGSDLVALVLDKVSEGMAKAMKKLGLSEGTMHIELRPGGDPNTSGIFAEPDEAGNLDKIVIHPEVFGAHLQRIKALNVPFILNEEIFHQIQNRAIHKEWLESGQTVPFLEFRQQYLRDVEAEMDADEKQRIELVYMGQAKMDGVAMKPESIVMEGTRMAFQGKLFGAITEATAGVRPKLTAFIELLVRYIRGIGPSKALQAELDKAVKVLGQMRAAQRAADVRAQKKQKGEAAPVAAPQAAPATDYTAEQEAAIETAINKAVNSVAADPQMRNDLKGPAAERVAKDLREGKVDADKPAQLFNSAKAGAVDAVRKSTAQKRGGGAVDASLEAESDEGSTLGERTEDATAEGADMGARRSVLRERLGEVFDQLTAEEQQVLEVAAEGVSTREGAKRIGVKSAQTYSARLRAAQAKAQQLLADKGISGAQDYAPAPEGLSPTEAAEVEAQRKGVIPIRNEQGELLGPNGEPSNLSERDWITVRTPFFKRWFGDWEAVAKRKAINPDSVSKVVDENGEPRVVWRGTQLPMQQTISPTRYEPHDFELDYTKEELIEDGYSDEEAEQQMARSVKYGGNNSIRIGDEIHSKSSGIFGIYFSRVKKYAASYGPSVEGFFLNLKNPIDDNQVGEVSGEYLSSLRNKGVDGLDRARGKEIIAFDSSQAKRTDNLGTFKTTDVRADFAAAPEGEGVDADVKLDKQIIRENLEKGLYNAEVLPERIAQEISGSGEGSTILAAENVARRSHRSIQQDHEEFADGPRGTAISAAQSIGKQARPLEDAALAEWAEQQGILYSDANKKEFIDEWGTQGERGGVESIVIFNDDTQRWTKINNLLMHSSQTEFLHRLAIHNYLFPNESYKLEGYVWQDNKSWRSDTPLGVMTDGGKPQLLPVISQPNVKHVGDEVSILESTAVLEALGGKWDSVEGGFVFEDGGFLIGDAHEENVLRRENDSLAFIDTDIRLLLSQKNDRLRAFAEGESEVEGDAAPAPDSDFETDTDPTAEQEQMVLGLKDGEEAIPPDINVPVWEKFKALMRGEWSGTDKLRHVGLGGLADRIELYEAKRGEFSGKLLETMRQWAKPLSREQIVEAHREALEYFAVREDYGGSLEANTLRRKLEEAKRDRDKARRKRDESDAAQRDALDPTELEARQQAVADADAKVQRLKRELDQRVAQEQRDAESRANAVLAELSDTATDLVRIMGDTSEQTGAMADSLGIKVQLPNGAWRRMVNLGRKHFPRVFSDEVVDAINNPAKFPELYAKLQGALVDGGYALDAKEAEKMLLDMQHEGEMAGASFLANAEMARGMRLPAEFYSTSPDTYFNFVNRFADRAAQIHAFGQSTNTSNDAFDTALKASKRSDQETRDFIKLVRGAVYRIRPKGNNKFYQRLQTFTTGGFLSGPFTAIRDVASGVALSAETFGALNTARAMWQTFAGHTKAAGRNLLRIKDGDFKWYQFQHYESSPDIEAALRLGAVREDFVEAMLLDERINDPNATDKLLLEGTNKALAFKRSMDSLARVTTLVASVHWLRTTQSLSRNNPEGRRFKQRLAALKRLGIEGDAVAKLLAGDAKAEEDFARKAVAEKQYTYSITQHPLFLASPDSTTKIFFQFQRWTFQRGRDLLKNVILPATHGTKVGGERVRDFAPVLRFAAAAALTGELLSLLREWLTDKERREALNEEIANADDTKAALIVDRLWKDMVMSGGLGLLGDYGTMVYELTDRGPRWRDPLAPPAVNLLKQLRDTVTSIAQQGLNGDAAVRELGKWINTLPPVNQLYGFGKGMTRRVMPDLVPVHAATRDRNFVRTLARRFGEEHDLDVEGSGGSFAKDEFTEQKKQLEEALLTGDIAEAREIKQSLLDDGMKLTAIRSSVRMRHPIRIGMVTKPELRRKFLRWAKQRVPSSVERIERTRKTYELTARRLGLF